MNTPNMSVSEEVTFTCNMCKGKYGQDYFSLSPEQLMYSTQEGYVIHCDDCRKQVYIVMQTIYNAAYLSGNSG